MDVPLLSPGVYVIAVSGGVDSVSLLHLLQQQPDTTLTVAHFDHGIRKDSKEDRLLVERQAKKYGLKFIYEEGHLGPKTSEATARAARYSFLRKVQVDTQVSALITAHHQDDLLETAIINLIRGTGRRGLSSLGTQPDILRPLLKVSKKELVAYAKKNKLAWREDSTNSDTKYLRNYVRHELLPKFTKADRDNFLKIIDSASSTNQEIDRLLGKHLKMQLPSSSLERKWFNRLPHAVSREVLASWLRDQGIRNFDRRTLERLAVAAKTAKPGQVFPILNGYNLEVNPKFLALHRQER